MSAQRGLYALFLVVVKMALAGCYGIPVHKEIANVRA
jgi:hypothetical protein